MSESSNKPWFFLLPFLFSIALSLPLQTLARCDCDSLPPFQPTYDQANVIFTGKVVGITTNPIKSGLKITFKIDQSWKRPIEHFATVNTNYQVQCGYPFKQDEKYLVYVTKRRSLYAQFCSRTQLLSEAGEDLQRLGKGRPPSKTPGMARMMWLMIGLTVLGLIFVAFVVLRKRIWKPKNSN